MQSLELSWSYLGEERWNFLSPGSFQKSRWLVNKEYVNLMAAFGFVSIDQSLTNLLVLKLIKNGSLSVRTLCCLAEQGPDYR